MQNITIRPYSIKDQAQVLHLLALNTPRYFAPEESADLLYYLYHEIEEYFVIEFKGKVVGSGGLNFSKDKRTGLLSWDIIHPFHQGKGLGTLLLNHRIKRLLTHWKVAHISVRTSQLVYAFYEKNGFQVKEKVKDYWAPGYDMYFMEYLSKNGEGDRINL